MGRKILKTACALLAAGLPPAGGPPGFLTAYVQKKPPRPLRPGRLSIS